MPRRNSSGELLSVVKEFNKNMKMLAANSYQMMQVLNVMAEE